MDVTEIEIVRKMQRGDENAFAWLFDRYQSKAFRAAYLISGNMADSEDIVQEAFVKCYLYREKLKEAERFEGWLFQILTRTAWRHIKKRAKEQPAEELWGDDARSGEKEPLDGIVEKESNRKLYEAIKELDVKQRTVIVLYYFNQFTTKETAAVMGCMEGTVKSRLYNARKNLKERLQQPEEEERYERRTV